MPAPNKKHAYLIARLLTILGRQLSERDYHILSQGAGLGIERVPLTYRLPDAMIFRTESLDRDRAETASNDPYIWTAPELIVECLSPSNRRGSIRELLADYARAAVSEAWLIDPKPPRFSSYRYESGVLRERLAVESGRVTPLLLPGVTVDLAELWEAFGV
jgi:Uma2 family endonuclease